MPPTHEPYLPLLPVARRHLPLAGTYCAYPRRDGQAELTWVAGSHTVINVPHRELISDTVTHPSTNRPDVH